MNLLIFLCQSNPRIHNATLSVSLGLCLHAGIQLISRTLTVLDQHNIYIFLQTVGAACVLADPEGRHPTWETNYTEQTIITALPSRGLKRGKKAAVYVSRSHVQADICHLLPLPSLRLFHKTSQRESAQ